MVIRGRLIGAIDKVLTVANCNIQTHFGSLGLQVYSNPPHCALLAAELISCGQQLFGSSFGKQTITVLYYIITGHGANQHLQ